MTEMMFRKLEARPPRRRKSMFSGKPVNCLVRAERAGFCDGLLVLMASTTQLYAFAIAKYQKQFNDHRAFCDPTVFFATHSQGVQPSPNQAIQL
jgi:hypothetical protein